jgi:hypothetical protein
MGTVLNYTPHQPLRIFVGEDEIAALPGAGTPVRLREEAEPMGTLDIDGRPVPLVLMDYGGAVGLPDPRPGTLLVVSQLVCRANPLREDLVFPIDLARNGAGDVVGCRGFAKVARPA